MTNEKQHTRPNQIAGGCLCVYVLQRNIVKAWQRQTHLFAR